MKTILLIEDNLELRENTAEILELANYKVIEAENGKIGVELAQKNSPDLIICDIMMPILDGYGVIHMLSNNSSTAKIPFIFLTAKSERGDFRKGMELGADDYITKPFDDLELLKAVEGRLKKAELLKAEISNDLTGINQFFNEIKNLNELKDLSGDRKVKNFKKKEIIFSEGNHPNYLYFLSKGKVKTYQSHEYGKEFITNLYKEGDFFGYISLLEDTPFSESAESLEESEILLIPKNDFYAVINNNSIVMRKFIQLLSDNIVEKEKKLIDLAYSSVRKRVANALITLYDTYNNKNEEIFNISIGREDLANIVGTATESLIRTLTDFKLANLIEVKGSKISIINYNKLKTLRG